MATALECSKHLAAVVVAVFCRCTLDFLITNNWTKHRPSV